MVPLVLLLAVAAVARGDDMAEFERMMAEPHEQAGWRDPADMGLGPGRGEERCAKELGQCRLALQQLAEERNASTTSASPPTSARPPVVATAATDVFLKRHITQLIARWGILDVLRRPQPGPGRRPCPPQGGDAAER
jgi:hypothetical protein